MTRTILRAAPLILASMAAPGLVLAQGAGRPAQTTAAASAPAKTPANSPLSGFGTTSKDPYKIDANRLEVQQKDNKAIYSGDVVVVQGKITMRCTTLHIFFESKKEEAKQPGKSANGAAAAAQPGANGLKRLECHGPVTITQEKQTATSNMMVFEKDTSVVTLTGNVIVSDGDNVQAGEKLVYDTKTGIGTMQGAGANQRIRGIFLPGSAPDADPSKKADKKPKTG